MARRASRDSGASRSVLTVVLTAGFYRYRVDGTGAADTLLAVTISIPV